MDIDKHFPQTFKEHSNHVEKIRSLMHFFKTAKICEGFVETQGTSPSSIPHVKGHYRDLSQNDDDKQMRTIAKDCLIFCPSSNGAKFCMNCYKLSRQQKKKEKRDITSTGTNNRWLTKDHLLHKLNTETKKRKAAEGRERYWRDKFYCQQLEMAEQDNYDIGLILF